MVMMMKMVEQLTVEIVEKKVVKWVWKCHCRCLW